MADKVGHGLVRKNSLTSSRQKFAKPPSYYLLHDSSHPKRFLPTHLYNRPLEEVDPFVFEDTFCMIGRKLGKNYVYRFSATKSLLIFGPLNPVRKFACRIIYSLCFDIFIILVILTNCVTLATSSNWEIGASGKFKKYNDMEFVVTIMEYVFVGVYTFEMILKVIAKGFVCNKFSYLRNVWNFIDFVIIVFGYVTIFLDDDSVLDTDLQSLSTLRVLRAIKTVSLIPGLRLMINALLKSVIQLVEVMTLTIFCLMIFALLALQLFMGKLLQKCVLMKNSEAHRKMVYEELSRDPTELNGGPIRPGDPDARKLWDNWVHKKENWLMRTYPFLEPVPCSNETVFGTGRVCPSGYVCLENIGGNFDRGWTSFDNFFSSMLTTFQMITTDFWERPYDLIMSTTNPFSVVFCIIVIFLGFFYLLNLMLAVVAMSYEREFKKKTEVPLTKQQKLSAHRKASTFSFHDPARLKVTVMTSYRKRTPSEREMLAKTLKESKEELEIADVDPTEVKGKKRPNLHDAIMSLLGRRVSMDGRVITKLTRTDSSIKSDISGQSLTSNLAFPHTEMVPTLQHDISPIVTPPKIPVIERIDSNPSIHSAVESFASTITKSAKLLAAALHLNANNCFTRRLLLIRTKLTPIVTNSKFEILITVMILMNTLLFASEHHGQPQWLDELVVETHGVGNIFFTTVFALEAIMKICALQNEYFTSWWNLFDFAIVLQSILDIALDQYQLFSAVFKPMRLLRIFKLAHTWITMKVLLNIIFSTFGALGNLTLVLIIVLYMFAILGLKVVGDYYVKTAFDEDGDDDEFPRWNWQNFIYAFMLVFRVICGEWIEPFLECVTATAKSNTEYKCFLIFLPVFIIGNLIILNLFLALLLNSFDSEELNSRHKKELENAGKADKLKKYVGMFLAQAPRASARDDESRRSSWAKSFDNINNAGNSTISRPRERFRVKAKQVILLNRKKVAERMLHEAEFRRKQMYSTRRFSDANSLLARHSVSFGVSQIQLDDLPGVMMSRRKPESCIPQKCWTLNCCIFRFMRKMKWHCWDSARNFALAIVTHPVFEWLILALIFASSITLCFEDVYLERRPNLRKALFYINITFSVIFVLEMFIKWFALGIWNYFTSWWTLLDFFIICVSVASWYFDYAESHMSHALGSGFSSLKALRTLRALRPLRAISRWQGMKIVVNALMFAIPSIINVLLVCVLFWLIFSIMGVQFFKGRFYRCVDNDSGGTVPVELVETREQCCKYTNKWSWVNQEPNFDHVFQGYLTLFQVATFEGWMEAMQASVDAVDINKQPIRDYNLLAYLYYVIFIVIGAFFILNLFIGVIIDNFNRLKKKYEGNLVEVFLTPSQLHYYTAMKKLGRKKPRKVITRPSSFFIGIFYDMSMSRRFEIVVFVLIFLNIFIMAFESYNQRSVYTNILDGFNALFTTIFALEAMAKIIGLRHYYFTTPWNIFDFILVCLSIIDIGLGETGRDLIPVPPTFLRVVRVFRVGRVLRLIKAATGIRKLLFALIVSLPALFNIGCLLFLITFIYAILGMTLFGGNAHNLAIDSVFNFDTFMRSCLMLLRLMTAAGWNDVLMAMTVEKPYCGTYRNIKCGRPGEGKCPDKTFAIIYIVSYIFISSLIVINMYVAIILENFYEANREEDVGIVEDDLEMFYIRWARYDPQATQFIAFEHLSEFLASLDKPLGVPIPNIVAIVAFNLPIALGNKIHCLDVLHALVKHVLGYIDDTEEFRKLEEQMEHKFRKQFPTRKLLNIVSSTRVWKIQHNAAVTIQRAWRAYQARKYPQPILRHTTISYVTRENLGNKKMKKKMGTLLHLGHKP